MKEWIPSFPKKTRRKFSFVHLCAECTGEMNGTPQFSFKEIHPSQNKPNIEKAKWARFKWRFINHIVILLSRKINWKKGMKRIITACLYNKLEVLPKMKRPVVGLTVLNPSDRYKLSSSKDWAIHNWFERVDKHYDVGEFNAVMDYLEVPT